MSITYILILAVLVYIAYQLYQLNNGKSAEKEELRLREMFPHLYSRANEEERDKIRAFVKRGGNDDISNYIYLQRFKHINSEIRTQTDEKKKEMMERRKEDISLELARWEKIFTEEVEKKEISQWEVDYLLCGYLEAINESFPGKDTDLNAYVKYSGFPTLSKRNT